MGGDRERWRVWAVVAVLAAAGNEVWMRLNWEGLRGANHQGQVSMVRFLEPAIYPGQRTQRLIVGVEKT